MKALQVVGRLLHYVGRYKLRLIVLLVLALLSVVFEVAKPLPIKIVIDNVLSNLPLPTLLTDLFGLSTQLDKLHLLYYCLAFLLCITVGNAVFSLLVIILTTNLAQRLVYDLSTDFYSKLQRLSLTFYKKNEIGDLMQRLTGDVFVVYLLVAQIVIPVITSLICLVAMFYIMILIDVVLALIALAVVPLLAISLALFAKPMNDSTTKQYQQQGQLSAFLQQSLSSMKIIQAFGRESFMYQKMQKQALALGRAYQVAIKISMSYNQVTTIITGLATTTLIGLGAYRGMQGWVSTGDLFIFIGYISALYGPVTALSTAFGTAITIGARGRRIFDVLDSTEMVKEKANAHTLDNPQGAIEFQNVTFNYDNTKEDRLIVNKISFSVLPGQIVAIVGPTGAGKTTLISLLTRFYDPQEGRITFDGIDLRDLKLSALRDNISLVLQEPFLFPMTIGENIAFGNPAASFEEIEEAARSAQAHHFILQQPQGYDTPIGESGFSLSGGEKQRLALARAFLKKAPVLILDEPTSAVDAYTEAKIFKALTSYAQGKTVFLISHRLSTLKHADQIITIKDGFVAEKGTHQSLLAENKVYANLYKHQQIN